MNYTDIMPTCRWSTKFVQRRASRSNAANSRAGSPWPFHWTPRAARSSHPPPAHQTRSMHPHMEPIDQPNAWTTPRSGSPTASLLTAGLRAAPSDLDHLIRGQVRAHRPGQARSRPCSTTTVATQPGQRHEYLPPIRHHTRPLRLTVPDPCGPHLPAGLTEADKYRRRGRPVAPRAVTLAGTGHTLRRDDATAGSPPTPVGRAFARSAWHHLLVPFILLPFLATSSGASLRRGRARRRQDSSVVTGLPHSHRRAASLARGRCLRRR